ncbi:putative F-box/LRR-repeat protein 23 [Heracleum sosnowskyi]|uniref:F-box/LRR-repeat protein 23 n=1 Tax=Heracleum sosnowskyi TaxID=360622 RepID=A0AAD8JKJ9_9APIA|nr:putative F-box/LRR-repeat protein 23 [Heracleum sosnowskyi]
MEKRKWENLNEDCLVNIFGRLDVESLLLDVPLVCKQWYRATFNPLSWQNLVFPVDIYPSRLVDSFNSRAGDLTFDISKLIKFVVGRSQGCATTVVLPDCISREDLIFVSDKCPFLKVLAVSSDPFVFETYEGDIGCAISDLLVKWKSLEVLKLDSCRHLVEIIVKIGLKLNCKNFVELSMKKTYIDQDVATAIVSNLSTIKRLVLDESNLEKVNLELILRGCKELELLYARDCVGFDEDDEEILRIASRIKYFQCKGSRTGIQNSYSGYNKFMSEHDYIDPHYEYDYDDYILYCDY